MAPPGTWKSRVCNKPACGKRRGSVPKEVEEWMKEYYTHIAPRQRPQRECVRSTSSARSNSAATKSASHPSAGCKPRQQPPPIQNPLPHKFYMPSAWESLSCLSGNDAGWHEAEEDLLEAACEAGAGRSVAVQTPWDEFT